jgi:NAD(P)-dependent dehydrogenase (short-subunit alcohol dehydrogenase family)
VTRPSPPARAGLTVLLTGATDGLGRALAERLAASGHDLVLHGRRPDALGALAGAIEASTGRAPRTVVADLSRLSEVVALAGTVAATVPRLDVLVNNAGVGGGEPDGTDRRTSPDGHELRLAVNHLAPALLSLDLLPLLRSTGRARIVNVASIGQSPVDVDDLELTRGYDGARAYTRSKLALIAFGLELATRVDPALVTVNSLHPGTYMPTKMVLESIGYTVDSLATGVSATEALIVAEDLDGVTGRFYDRRRVARANAQAYDPDFRRWLWSTTLRILDRAEFATLRASA